jgi:hypothetical protein
VGHAKGYGVQSPAAYQFVRQVLFAPSDSAVSAAIGNQWPHMDRRTRRLGQLYYRLARHLQPGLIVDFATAPDACRAYMAAGCPDAVVQAVPPGRPFADYSELVQQLGTIDLARITLADGCDGFVESALDNASAASVFIIENIWRDDLSRLWWDELRHDERVSVSYDLYLCGLLTFNPKLYKRTYLLNL